MMDVTTYCDVIENCTECPRYGDDCDGDKRVEHTDLISRADAINAVHKYFVEAFNNEPHEIDEDGDDVFTDMKSVNALLHHNKMVSKALKALPSADAVHGEWHQISPARIYECSICNHNVLTDYIDTYNFCPNCGAKMKGADDE